MLLAQQSPRVRLKAVLGQRISLITRMIRVWITPDDSPKLPIQTLIIRVIRVIGWPETTESRRTFAELTG